MVKRENGFTDDTVCTIAVADAILKHQYPTVEQFRNSIQEWCKKYPNRGYGGKFRNWINNPVPYGSWGNGAAMRVSACGLAASSPELASYLAWNSCKCSHNTPDAILGAMTVAEAVFFALLDKKNAKDIIRESLLYNYPEYANLTLDQIRPRYRFDSSCKGSVPVALLCFLESESYENCLKLAISMGGDADTLAAIAGGIAYPYYGTMQKLVSDNILEILPKDMLQVVIDFDRLT